MEKIAAALVFCLAWLFLASPTPAHAFNPLQRECRMAGWEFRAVPYGKNDVALCIAGDIIIDAQTLLSGRDGDIRSAAKTILNDQSAGSCADVGAPLTWNLPTGENVCIFRDTSMLGLDMIRTGLSVPDRVRLKQVLTTL